MDQNDVISIEPQRSCSVESIASSVCRWRIVSEDFYNFNYNNMPWDGRQRGELWSSTIVYSVEAPWRIISREFPQLPICLETDSKEENDDYRPRTIKTHHFIADRPPAPFNELFHKEVVDEITGNNEFVQLLGEVSPPASTSIPSPDSWPARCKEASSSIAASAFFWKKKDISYFKRIRAVEWNSSCARNGGSSNSGWWSGGRRWAHTEEASSGKLASTMEWRWSSLNSGSNNSPVSNQDLLLM